MTFCLSSGSQKSKCREIWVPEFRWEMMWRIHTREGLRVAGQGGRNCWARMHRVGRLPWSHGGWSWRGPAHLAGPGVRRLGLWGPCPQSAEAAPGRGHKLRQGSFLPARVVP